MPDALPPGTSLSAMVPLAEELGDLKRLRDASSPDSIASRLFRRAWAALLVGGRVETVALATTADALAAARLGGIDRSVLLDAGLTAADTADVLRRSFDQVAVPLDPALADHLRTRLGQPVTPAPAPDFAEALIRQPRAGATCPGRPRLVLEPPENHGDHCLVVATLAVLLAPAYGADPAVAFLAGLAHHLHNAVLPDSGFAGEMLLGDHLAPVMATLFDRALATLPAALDGSTRNALALIPDAATPVGRAFHAADVIDRVLQMRHYDRVAHFTTSQALDDLELVHAGPVQAFHHAVLASAGLP